MNGRSDTVPQILASSVFLTGPTAAGKSEVALLLAERLNGEIISVDSMQVYRGLDIGTAKPSETERARVPHHLIDICELAECFNAARFVDLASAAAKEIVGRAHVPIFCGGTGLYFKAFLYGLGVAPASALGLRQQLEQSPLNSLLAELERLDPVTHERIDRKNPRRVIRAMEVIRLTGKPFSEQKASWVGSDKMHRRAKVWGIKRSKEDLRGRIERRVDEMFARGLVEETKGLLRRGLASNHVALQALGYRQVVEYLDGQRPLNETIELVKTRTRQFAKRQITWFKGQLGVQWFDLSGEVSVSELAERLGRAKSTGGDARSAPAA